jgi:hypothetical protein
MRGTLGTAGPRNTCWKAVATSLVASRSFRTVVAAVRASIRWNGNVAQLVPMKHGTRTDMGAGSDVPADVDAVGLRRAHGDRRVRGPRPTGELLRKAPVAAPPTWAG